MDDLARLLAERDCARLIALYAASADARDGGIPDLFTPDGVLETPLGSAQGRDAIRAFVAEAPDRATLHLCGNIVVEVSDADHGIGRCDAAFFAAGRDGAGLSLRVIGSYADEFRRQDGRWLFARRVFSAR